MHRVKMAELAEEKCRVEMVSVEVVVCVGRLKEMQGKSLSGKTSEKEVPDVLILRMDLPDMARTDKQTLIVE